MTRKEFVGHIRFLDRSLETSISRTGSDMFCVLLMTSIRMDVFWMNPGITGGVIKKGDKHVSVRMR